MAAHPDTAHHLEALCRRVHTQPADLIRDPGATWGGPETYLRFIACTQLRQENYCGPLQADENPCLRRGNGALTLATSPQ